MVAESETALREGGAARVDLVGDGVLNGASARLVLPALLAFVALLPAYFVVRSGGRWADNDTAAMSLVIRATAATGRLVPPSGDVYPQGYGYAATAYAVSALAGIDVGQMQRVVLPLLTTALVFPAWALYRELTGSQRVAALATLLLFIQPEFLFVVLRGSHERMLRALMLVALWLLVRSFRHRDQPGAFAVHVCLFYMTAYAMIATNVLFGASFLAAIATALGLAWALGRRHVALRRFVSTTAARLLSIVMVVGGLGFTFAFYVYPPATASLRALKGLGQALAALLFSTTTTANPYTSVSEGWVSLPIYFLVSAGDYLLLVAAAVVWARQGWTWLRLPPNDGQVRVQAWLVWLLTAAFAMQGALAVVSDRTGALGGNLELRAFPSFAMVATPMVAVAIADLWRGAGHAPARFAAPRLRRRVSRRLAASALASGVGLLAGLGLLKASDEPLLSNRWLFSTESELRAVRWAEAHSRDDDVWLGYDDRLRSTAAVVLGPSRRDNLWDAFDPKPSTRAFLISDVTRLRSARMGKALPAGGPDDRLYDSGDVQLYRLRPTIPYQH